MITYVKGDLFESGADALVNATNTKGVMGGGIAAEFKRRFPAYFEHYKQMCDLDLERVGEVGRYARRFPTIFSLHTKDHYRDPSRYLYVATGLKSLKEWSWFYEFSSIAIPALGCGLGGLEWPIVKALIEDGLDEVSKNIDIKVYEPL